MAQLYIFLENIQDDSNLLSGFPWSIIFKPEEQVRLLMQNEILTQKVLVYIEPILQLNKQPQQAHFFSRKQFYFAASD